MTNNRTWVLVSVTRFGDLLDFGQLFKPLALINLAIFSGHTDSGSHCWVLPWVPNPLLLGLYRLCRVGGPITEGGKSLHSTQMIVTTVLCA